MCEDKLTPVINTIVSLVRTIHLKRALASVDADPGLNFWRVIHGNLLDVAVLEWCKLFGNDDKGHQPTHWKTVIDDHAAFRAELFAQLGIAMPAWQAYWSEMTTYRDKRVAHHDMLGDDITHYPAFDLALASAQFYYGKAIAVLRSQGIEKFPDDLAEYGARFETQATKAARLAIGATTGVEERVR